MSVIPAAAPARFQVPPYPIWKFTVDQYHRLIQSGILTEDDPVELLEGWIAQKMPRNPPHDGTISTTESSLRALQPAGWHVRVQSAVTLADSEPEPDLAVVRGGGRDYMSRHPAPPDIALLVEVADSSLDRDRTDKSRIYARANIALYWIINLVDGLIEVYTDPTGPVATPGYRQQQDYDRNAQVPVVIDGATVGHLAVRDLLP